LAVLAITSLCLAACEQPPGSQVTPEPTTPPTTPTPTTPPTPSPTPDITRWELLNPVLAGYRDPPGENLFIVNIENEQIGTTGGEMLFKVVPVGYDDCSQLFRVGWDFVETDVAVVTEGQRISIQVYNQPEGGLNECYVQAKAAKYYGSELTIELQGAGGSHFGYQPEYARHFQGASQYLFELTQGTGMVYPVGPTEPHGSAMGGMRVKNGAHVVGDANASHGSLSLAVSMGGVFWYTITYLYEPG
jgi:hypothetical protein